MSCHKAIAKAGGADGASKVITNYASLNKNATDADFKGGVNHYLNKVANGDDPETFSTKKMQADSDSFDEGEIKKAAAAKVAAATRRANTLATAAKAAQAKTAHTKLLTPKITPPKSLNTLTRGGSLKTQPTQLVSRQNSLQQPPKPHQSVQSRPLVPGGVQANGLMRKPSLNNQNRASAQGAAAKAAAKSVSVSPVSSKLPAAFRQ